MISRDAERMHNRLTTNDGIPGRYFIDISMSNAIGVRENICRHHGDLKVATLQAREESKVIIAQGYSSVKTKQ
jgi:hypothetical protein